MNEDIKYVLEILKEINKSDWNFERKELFRKAIKHFRQKGYSNRKIRELFETIELKEQDNSQMISNNNRYLNLLNELLNE